MKKFITILFTLLFTLILMISTGCNEKYQITLKIVMEMLLVLKKSLIKVK